MKSVLLHIIPVQDGNDYSMELLSHDEEEGVVRQVLAHEILPSDWSNELPLIDPNTAQPILKPELLRDMLVRKQVTADILEKAGEFLFRLLFRGAVGDTWKQLEHKTRDKGGLRTYLKLEAQELQLLPWELLKNPAHPRAFFLDQNLSFVRGEPVSTLQPYHLPIRILVVIACAPSDEKLDWSAEIIGIKEAFYALRQVVFVKVLKNPGRDKLKKVYKKFKPEIFHFIGHGRADADGKAALVLEPEEEHATKEFWTVQDILEDLQGPMLRLAFINACDSSAVEERTDMWSIAGGFVDLGAKAVLAMQGEITGSAAALIGTEVYRHIAQGMPIDHALLQARLALRACGGQGSPKDWCLPVLRVTIPPSQVLAGHPETMRKWQMIREEKVVLPGFVDREKQRELIFKKVSWPKNELSSSGVFLLNGKGKVGKTTMLRWCMETCSVQGHQVVYRNCSGSDRMNFVQLLRFIRDGCGAPEKSFDQAIKPSSSFVSFNACLNEILKPDTEDPIDAIEEDRGYPLSNDGGHEQMFEKMAGEFRQALSGVTTGEPLTIALDHVGASTVLLGQFKKFFERYILKPAAQGEIEGLRIIIAVSNDQYEMMSLGSLTNASKMELEPFASELFCALAADFFSGLKSESMLRNEVSEEFIRQLIDLHNKLISQNVSWMPIELHKLALTVMK